MSLCPYTYITGLFKKGTSAGGEAQSLRVLVYRDGVEKVSVTLPARSARWLIDLIPEDVVLKIKEEKIPIEDIQKELAESPRLFPRDIFSLMEQHRSVKVWLE